MRFSFFYYYVCRIMKVPQMYFISVQLSIAIAMGNERSFHFILLFCKGLSHNNRERERERVSRENGEREEEEEREEKRGSEKRKN